MPRSRWSWSQLEDYAQLPITGERMAEHQRALARVNFMREEPAGCVVNDLAGPLYILDKQTKKFTVY